MSDSDLSYTDMIESPVYNFQYTGVCFLVMSAVR